MRGDLVTGRRAGPLVSVWPRVPGLNTLARLASGLRWSHWRRRHQARARWHHYAARLEALAT